jgi:4-amino-4-deoxy-L-arabinose transferase-like glycosyltransferase
MSSMAAIYLIRIWQREQSTGTLLASFLLAGYCFTIKYTGILVMLPVAGTALWELRQTSRRAAAQALLAMALAAAIAPLPYLVRNLVWYPAPFADEIRSPVRAAGINFADTMLRLGLYPTTEKTRFIPGFEAAGIVDAVGTDITQLAWISICAGAPGALPARLGGSHASCSNIGQCCFASSP